MICAIGGRFLTDLRSATGFFELKASLRFKVAQYECFDKI
jgi:hypothetical protein